MPDKNKKIGTVIIIASLLLLAILVVYLVLSFKLKQEEIKPAESVLPQKEESVKPPESIVKPPEPIAISDDFQEAILQLDTSDKLITYLNQNFTFEPREGDIALDYQEFFEKKKGGEQDFMAFLAYVLSNHDFETGIMKYRYSQKEGQPEKEKLITIFREKKEFPEYITFVNGSLEKFEAGWSFEETCQKEEQRLGIKISQYLIFPAKSLDFSQPAEGYEWRKR